MTALTNFLKTLMPNEEKNKNGAGCFASRAILLIITNLSSGHIVDGFHVFCFCVQLLGGTSQQYADNRFSLTDNQYRYRNQKR